MQLPSTNIVLQPYQEQLSSWPNTGEHILASFDEDSIVVYQAYKTSIASHAVTHQSFGGDFSYNRMSWIKTNFLWMMYRSGWATKENQEAILAIRISRAFFDEIVIKAIHAHFQAECYTNTEVWKNALQKSDVRLQWDPDHSPSGERQARRAIQLGIRGETLRRYGQNEIERIDDISDYVARERTKIENRIDELVLPKERVYVPHKPS